MPSSHRPVLLGLLAAGLLAGDAWAKGGQVFLEIEAPRDNHVRGSVGLVEVRGWAGTGLRGTHDVLIAIDRSASVWRPSGADVDGDGRVGKQRGPVGRGDPEGWSSDPGDTLFQAELLAARRLFERVNPKTTRMGLLSFGSRARVRAPLGSSRDALLRALDDLPESADPETWLHGALKRASEEFARNPRGDGPEPNHTSLILLSDGAPTSPAPVEIAEAFAVQGAQRAANEGIRIYAFALGPEAIASQKVFAEITNATGGDLILVDQPGEVVDFVPHLSLTELESVAVENLTNGEKARAVRLFPDGSFDAYAPLAPGENRLRITARSSGGGQRVVERRIFFIQVPATTPAELEALEKLLEDLRARTLETELADRARRRLFERVRRLEIKAE
jgi:hypothetical protein